MTGGISAQLKPLFGRRQQHAPFLPPRAVYNLNKNGRRLDLISLRHKRQLGFTEGLSLKCTRVKSRSPIDIKCVKAANGRTEWYRDRADALWKERIVPVLREVTPLEVLKWAAMAAIAIWGTKFIVGALFNPYLWMYASWFFVVWPRPAAVALGIAILFPAYKKIQGNATKWEETFLVAGALTSIIIVPFAHFHGYIEGGLLMLSVLYFAFFLTGYYIRSFKYGNDLNRKQPYYVYKKQPWKTIVIPRIAQIGFALAVVGGHLYAAYESPGMVGGGNPMHWILILLALAFQYNAIWYLDKYSDKTLDQPFVVVIYGPYRLLRHPMYTSTMLLFTGYCMALRAYKSLAFIVLVCFLYYELKSRLEEDSLVAIFGEAYTSYRKIVKQKFLPFVY